MRNGVLSDCRLGNDDVTKRRTAGVAMRRWDAIGYCNSSSRHQSRLERVRPTSYNAWTC